MFACAHPAIERRHPRAADPADRPRLRRRHHRLRFPRLARHHEPAPGACQEQDQAGRHSVSRARARRICASGSMPCSRPSTPPSPKAGPMPPAPRFAAVISPRKRIWLGRLVASLLPDEPEALGLLALMLHAEARRAARRDARRRIRAARRAGSGGCGTCRLIDEAEALLRRASAVGRDRALSARSGDPVGPRRAPAHRRAPTGRRSSGSTTRCRR